MILLSHTSTNIHGILDSSEFYAFLKNRKLQVSTDATVSKLIHLASGFVWNKTVNFLYSKSVFSSSLEGQDVDVCPYYVGCWQTAPVTHPNFQRVAGVTGPFPSLNECQG